MRLRLFAFLMCLATTLKSIPVSAVHLMGSHTLPSHDKNCKSVEFCSFSLFIKIKHDVLITACMAPVSRWLFASLIIFLSTAINVHSDSDDSLLKPEDSDRNVKTCWILFSQPARRFGVVIPGNPEAPNASYIFLRFVWGDKEPSRHPVEKLRKMENENRVASSHKVQSLQL